MDKVTRGSRSMSKGITQWWPLGRLAFDSVLTRGLTQAAGKAIPYGVYDMARNEAWVSVGRDHDTSAVAVAAIRHWWGMMGRAAYPAATHLLVTADAGGSNGYRTRAWKTELQRLFTRILGLLLNSWASKATTPDIF